MSIFLRHIITISLVLAAQPLFAQQDPDRVPEAEFHMARMVYADGGAFGRGRGGFRRGWWAIDYPQAEYHFTRGVRRLSNIEVAEDSQHVHLLDDDLYDYPWLFVQQIGQGYWQQLLRIREDK